MLASAVRSSVLRRVPALARPSARCLSLTPPGGKKYPDGVDGLIPSELEQAAGRRLQELIDENEGIVSP